jgi:hypothetical protein
MTHIHNSTRSTGFMIVHGNRPTSRGQFIPGAVQFPVPGMYGGYRLEIFEVDAKVVAESLGRGAGGSGQRHEITSKGSQLVDEVFV